MATNITKECDEIVELEDELKDIESRRNPDPNDPLSKFPSIETPASLRARETKARRRLSELAITVVKKLKSGDCTLDIYRLKPAVAAMRR